MRAAAMREAISWSNLVGRRLVLSRGEPENRHVMCHVVVRMLLAWKNAACWSRRKREPASHTHDRERGTILLFEGGMGGKVLLAT